MKSISSTAVLRQVFRFIFFASVSLFAINAIIAQTNNNSSAKPKAILFAEWIKPGESLQPQTAPVRSLARARMVTDQNFSRTTANSLSGETLPIPRKFAGLVAALKPTALEQQAFVLVNEQRRLQNLPPLEWDAEMLYVAREHSQNMSSLNFFSHKGRDGKTADDRANDIGVKGWSLIGENIAFNQGIKNNVEFAVQCWLYSPHHKENLLGKKWTRSGIGIAQNPDGKFYITQVFRN